jgi:hypothetical protein
MEDSLGSNLGWMQRNLLASPRPPSAMGPPSKLQSTVSGLAFRLAAGMGKDNPRGKITQSELTREAELLGKGFKRKITQ